MEKRALVLGGGGVTGVAWEIGLIHGLAEQGLDLTTADLFIGTSAGSVVAAQLSSSPTPPATATPASAPGS
jgi:NTE family protein